ncbi:MAG: peptidoglycan-binding protein [Propionibacteriaceae bacterium]|nr:peptidoglycan-binding protein [Propionibacteriaceae bacterium]
MIGATGLGFVFGRWAFLAPQMDDINANPATVTVTEMTVGRSIPAIVGAVWPARPFGVGGASGVLTSISVTDGAMVNEGDVLYTVDLRPVLAAVGAVPSFRDLTQGIVGRDVAQLQGLLIDKGLFRGAPNGVFDAATARAVLAWQKSVGVKEDGVVRVGDIVFADKLPARVRLVDGMAVGKRLAPGDVVLSVLDADPQFTVTVLPNSALDSSKPLEVMINDQVVQAVVFSSSQDRSGDSIWVLSSNSGGPICADKCGEVSLDPTEAVFSARQVVTPEVTGPGVPAAAVWLRASGDPYLLECDGTELPVTIVAEGEGGVVLNGVADGVVVVLAGQSIRPMTPTSSSQPTEAPS